MFLKAAEVVEGLVANGQRNNGIDEVVVDLNAGQCGKDQGNRMAEGKGGDKFDDVDKAMQKNITPNKNSR